MTPEKRELALLVRYSEGSISRREIEKKTKLWFGEILIKMGEVGLRLPRINIYEMYSEKQKALFDEIFTPRKV